MKPRNFIQVPEMNRNMLSKVIAQLEPSTTEEVDNAVKRMRCFPSYRLDMPSVELAKVLLEEVYVATVPGAAFGACGEGHLRLSYATSTDRVAEAFERMETFLRRRAGDSRPRAISI